MNLAAFGHALAAPSQPEPAPSEDADEPDLSEPRHHGDLDEERMLVERARQGDGMAFRQLYERHAGAVHRFAILPLVRNRTLAEDLLADTFLRAFEHLHRFQWQGRGLLPWLVRIAKNLCFDHLRRATRADPWPVGFEQFLPDPTEWNAESVLAHGELSELLRVRITVCLEAVHPRYRRVLELRLVSGLSREAAATSLGVSIGTLDVLLFRACKAFRRIFVERFGTRPSDPDASTL